MSLFTVFAVVCSFFCVAMSQTAASRADVQTYLQSVYPLSNFTAMSDSAVFAFYDTLTYYYPGHPYSPNWNRKGKQSHPYAGTVCDCLHIDLDMCENKTMDPTAKCEFWPIDTFLNLDHVLKQQTGFPSNVWYEGLSYPGEWGFPISCQNTTLGSEVYAFHKLMWHYPVQGNGVFFNTGNTAWAYNKPHWLLKYSGGQLGSTPAQIMDAMAELVCTNYQTVSGCNPQCQDDQKDDPQYCCCHGRRGGNLGMQVSAVKNQYGLTWTQAQTAVALMYSTGMTGEENFSAHYPNGTFFGYIDMLDNTIKGLQIQNQYDTVQFIREPQHGGYHSDPVYAFEILYHTPYARSYYRWTDYCNVNQRAIAVLDPLADKGYLPNGFVQSGAATKTLSAFVPQPAFAALFKSNMKK